ncbi:hypothetical protein KUF71_026046, partial [Frankliniella fusca]
MEGTLFVLVPHGPTIFCPGCSVRGSKKSGYTYGSLRSHVQRCHQAELKFVCRVCRWEDHNKQMATYHLQKEHGLPKDSAGASVSAWTRDGLLDDGPTPPSPPGARARHAPNDAASQPPAVPRGLPDGGLQAPSPPLPSPPRAPPLRTPSSAAAGLRLLRAGQLCRRRTPPALRRTPVRRHPLPHSPSEILAAATVSTATQPPGRPWEEVAAEVARLLSPSSPRDPMACQDPGAVAEALGVGSPSTTPSGRDAAPDTPGLAMNHSADAAPRQVVPASVNISGEKASLLPSSYPTGSTAAAGSSASSSLSPPAAPVQPSPSFLSSTSGASISIQDTWHHNPATTPVATVRSPPSASSYTTSPEHLFAPPSGSQPSPSSKPSKRQAEWIARLEGARDWATFEAVVDEWTASLQPPRQARRQGRPQGSRRGRQDAAQEARRLQRLYRTNRKRAMRDVRGEDSPLCPVPTEEVETYFKEVFKGRQMDLSAVPDGVALPVPQLNDGILATPIGREAIAARLARATNTAPGPDGVDFNTIKSKDRDAHIIEEMQQLLDAVSTAAEWIGLRFNAKKCATLCLEKKKAIAVNTHVQGDIIGHLSDGETYQHLGVPTGFRADQTPSETIERMLLDIHSVEKSLLAPWQKLDALRTFVVPQIQFALQTALIQKTSLAEVDRQIKRVAKGALHLPRRASPEVVFLPTYQGGANILPLADLADISAVTHAFRLLTSPDPAVSTVAELSLKRTASKYLNSNAGWDDAAAYLSGVNIRNTSAFATIWSHARSATKRLTSKIPGIHWSWAYNNRHRSVLHNLVTHMQSTKNLRIERAVPEADSRLMPDLVVIDNDRKLAIIVDVACPFDNRQDAFLEKRNEKISKYTPICNILKTKGYRAIVDAVLVGSLGSWDPANFQAL